MGVFHIKNKCRSTYVGELITPANGFTRYTGKFDKALWYDPKDDNWGKLVKFLKDKSIPFDGKQTLVLDIIGYN